MNYQDRVLAVWRLWDSDEHTLASVASTLGLTRGQVSGILNRFNRDGSPKRKGRLHYVVGHDGEAICKGYTRHSVIAQARRILNAESGEAWTPSDVKKMIHEVRYADLGKWRFE